jgi:hypothetical protein
VPTASAICGANQVILSVTHHRQNPLKVKAIPVTGCGGPKGCETSRLPHFLDSRLTDGGEVVILIRRPSALYPQEDSWYSGTLRLEGLG